MVARVLSKWEIGVKYKRRLTKVYARLDSLLAAGPRPEIDPIAPDTSLSAATRERIEAGGEKLRASGVDAAGVEALVSYLLHASDQDVARIRPIELAKKFGVPGDAMIQAGLHAAQPGGLSV